MDSNFWHERWQRGETGWHLPQVHPLLEQSWLRLAIPRGARVLLPLCGKSEDMAWLADQGYRVVGVELSAAAAEAFFTEHDSIPDIDAAGGFRRFRSGTIEILCGDFFDLEAELLGAIDAVYDRGALVALPPAMREKYVGQLRTVIPTPLPGLLITLDYPQQQMDGPPFAVSQADVGRYFGATHTIRLLTTADALDDSPRFRERGITHMTENAFALTPKP
jgi:thiopurine S-methyltransferase